MKRLATIVAGIAVVALAACGSGGSHPTAKADSGSPATESPTTAAHARKHAAAKTHAAAKKHAAAKQSTSTKSSVTVEGASLTPTTVDLHLLVLPAVAAGGAAPVKLPTETSVTPGTKAPGGGPTTTIKPYNPGDGIDLSGTPGVTAAQQAAAEQLIRDTIKDIAKYQDQSVAFADGYRTIGDGITGDEHWVNWAYGTDSHVLDANYPESLVYNTRTPGHPVLEAAMYSLTVGSRFSDIPPLFQSPLTQFHVHNNLCFAHTSDPLQLVVAGFTSNGICPAGLLHEGIEPMIHVWITPNACGPFAALSGIAAGTVPDGQTPNCDTAHAGVL
jgi:hypothetical protein